MNKRYSEEVYKAFKAEREEFFRKHFPELFKEEVFFEWLGKKAKLNVIKETDLYGMTPTHNSLPFDYCFSLGIKYRKCLIYDSKNNEWVTNYDRMKRDYTESPHLYGIFRNEINFPFRALIERLVTNKINFVCLRKYTGGLTEKEFETELLKKGIYVWFAKS